jgi:CHRD domain
MRATCRQLGRIALLLVIGLIGVAGCGGSASSTPSSAPNRPLRLYRVKLTGAAAIPRGAVNGSGGAIIAIHRGSVVCWRFVHLHGFLNATAAQIGVGFNAKAGRVLQPLSSGPRLRHRGCVQASPGAVIAIEREPSSYYVDVQSQLYPDGAVRGQL